MENSREVPQKIKNGNTVHNSSNPISEYTPKRTESRVFSYLHTHFTTAYSQEPKGGNNTKVH